MSDVTKDEISFAGDINIEKLDLLGSFRASQNTFQALDIRPQVGRIEIFESIFSPFTTSRFFVNDGANLLNNVPLRGEEIINFLGGTPSLNQTYLKFDMAFHIFNITNKSQASDRTSTYVLHGISAEAFVDNNKKISKSFTGNISNIVKTIVSDPNVGLCAKKKVEIEPTSNATHYISNFWTPTKNLDFLANTAVSADGYPTYVFFENRNGFNFISIERLYKNNPIQIFVKDNKVDGSKAGIVDKYNRITMIETPELFDYYENSDRGVFGSDLHTYDITAKRYKAIQYVSTLDSDRVLLNKNLPYTPGLIKGSQNVKLNEITEYGLFDDIKDVSNTKILQKRKARLAAANYHCLKIMVPGRSDYTVGYTVDVEIPADSPVSENDETRKTLDPLLSGKYIIAEINHMITGTQHTCTMTLIKDSVG